MAQVGRDHASLGSMMVLGAGRTNDLPNVADTKIWIGNGSGVPTAYALSGDVTMTNAGVCTVSGGSTPNKEINLPAGSFDYPVTNPAPLDTDTGTNGSIKRHLFDDTTEEFIQGVFQIPADMASGTVTFEAWGYAKTADGNEIQLRFGYVSLAKSESWDTAYVDKDSGDYVTDSTQDDLDYLSWTETTSNLNFVAGEFVRFQISRIAIDDGTPLSGDWGLTSFRITIPRG